MRFEFETLKHAILRLPEPDRGEHRIHSSSLEECGLEEGTITATLKVHANGRELRFPFAYFNGVYYIAGSRTSVTSLARESGLSIDYLTGIVDAIGHLQDAPSATAANLKDEVLHLAYATRPEVRDRLKAWLIAETKWSCGAGAGRTHETPAALNGIADLQRWDPVVMSGIGFVYFLCRQGQVIYVGQTLNLRSRLGCHAREKPFAEAFYIQVIAEDLDEVERYFIRKLKPRLNVSLPKTCCEDLKEQG